MLIFLFIKCVFFERHPPFAPGGEGVPHTGGPGGLWKRFILRWHSNSAGRWKCVQGGSRYWFTLPAGVGVRPCAAWRTSRYADNKMPVGKRRSAKLPEESRLRGYRAHPSRPTFTISQKPRRHCIYVRPIVVVQKKQKAAHDHRPTRLQSRDVSLGGTLFANYIYRILFSAQRPLTTNRL